MPNKFLTPKIIAKEALMILRANSVMSRLVHRDYSKEFVPGRGDTISIRKPATFETKEFSGKIEVQNAEESSLEVKMDHHLDVSFAVTSEQMALDIESFSKQLLAPAMMPFADTIDSLILGLYKDVPYSVGTGGTLPKSIDSIVDAGTVLNQNKVPLGQRSLVVDPRTEGALLKLDTFHDADKVGDNGTALREASLGRKFGFNTFMDQNVHSHEGGKLSAAPKIKQTYEKGVSTIALNNSSLTGTVKAGDTLVIDGTSYVITGEATASGNEITVNITPALKAQATTGSKVTYTGGAGIENLAFHKNAFALVTRSLAIPSGAAKAYIENYDGFGLRVVYGYDLTTKTDTISIDMLCGVKTLDPALAVRLRA